MFILLQANNSDTKITATPYPTKDALLRAMEQQFLAAFPDAFVPSAFPERLGWRLDGWEVAGENFEASITEMGASITHGHDMVFWDIEELPFVFTTSLCSLRSSREYADDEKYHSVELYPTYEAAHAEMVKDFEALKDEKIREAGEDDPNFAEIFCGKTTAVLRYYEHEFRWEIQTHTVTSQLHGDAAQMYEGMCRMLEYSPDSFRLAQVMMCLHQESKENDPALLLRLAEKISDAYDLAASPTFTVADLAEAICHESSTTLPALAEMAEEPFADYVYRAAEDYRCRMTA